MNILEGDDKYIMTIFTINYFYHEIISKKVGLQLV